MINKCDPPPGQDNDSNATRPRAEKTVDDSWSTDWSSLIKFSYLFYSGQVKILVNDLGTLMILDTKTNSLSAYKLLQLLRRLTGWAMMAADDIDWSWERSDNTHQRIPGAGPSWAPAGKSRWRRKQCCRFSTAQHREETDWRRKLEAWIFNGALVAKGAKFQWKIQLDHFASPFVTHSSASQSGNQIYITLGQYPDFCPKIPKIQFCPFCLKKNSEVWIFTRKNVYTFECSRQKYEFYGF